jgi:hypothetical protein
MSVDAPLKSGALSGRRGAFASGFKSRPPADDEVMAGGAGRPRG